MLGAGGGGGGWALKQTVVEIRGLGGPFGLELQMVRPLRAFFGFRVQVQAKLQEARQTKTGLGERKLQKEREREEKHKKQQKQITTTYTNKGLYGSFTELRASVLGGKPLPILLSSGTQGLGARLADSVLRRNTSGFSSPRPAARHIDTSCFRCVVPPGLA